MGVIKIGEENKAPSIAANKTIAPKWIFHLFSNFNILI
jgi:hypothetical protein